jgi:hypothetical protein
MLVRNYLGTKKHRLNSGQCNAGRHPRETARSTAQSRIDVLNFARVDMWACAERCDTEFPQMFSKLKGSIARRKTTFYIFEHLGNDLSVSLGHHYFLLSPIKKQVIKIKRLDKVSKPKSPHYCEPRGDWETPRSFTGEICIFYIPMFTSAQYFRHECRSPEQRYFIRKKDKLQMLLTRRKVKSKLSERKMLKRDLINN